MSDGTPFVMFGIHPLFGDYVDAIHANGGHLNRVVLNVEEPERPTGQSFAEALARYHQWRARQGDDRKVEVLWLDDYEPLAEEVPLLGFRGCKALPLIRHLKTRHGTDFPPLVHPEAYVSPMTAVAEGVFIGAGTVIAPNCSIGEFSLVNRCVSVGHDVTIERFVILSPSSNIASSVHLHENSVVGIGATIIENLAVGKDSYIAAGAVVLQDVEDGVMVAGIPAKRKKTRGHG